MYYCVYTVRETFSTLVSSTKNWGCWLWSILTVYCLHLLPTWKFIMTSRSDHTDIVNDMGVKYTSLSDPQSFLDEGLDVIISAVSILSFEKTIRYFAPHLESYISKSRRTLRGPLIVDVLLLKYHPRKVGVIFDPTNKNSHQMMETYADSSDDEDPYFTELRPNTFDRIHENSQAHIKGKYCMERFLSIWEEKGCRMVAISCANHNTYAAKSQFITHLMGRIMGSQGLAPTHIDTKMSLHMNSSLSIFGCL